jgi:hypothetical protein
VLRLYPSIAPARAEAVSARALEINERTIGADAGYCSEANLEALESRGIDGYVATGRARDAVAGRVKDEGAVCAVAPRAPEEPASRRAEPTPAATLSRVEAMRAKIKAGGHASPYRLRKQLPEPGARQKRLASTTIPSMPC